MSDDEIKDAFTVLEATIRDDERKKTEARVKAEMLDAALNLRDSMAEMPWWKFPRFRQEAVADMVVVLRKAVYGG